MAMTEKEHIVKAFDAELKSLLSNMLDMAGPCAGSSQRFLLRSQA